MIHVIFLFFLMLTLLASLTKKKAFLWAGIMVLFITAALRYGYGNDYFNYDKIFSSAKGGVNVANIEWLFYEINRFMPSYQFLLACVSLLYLCVVYYVVNKYVPIRYWLFSFTVFIANPYLFLMSLSAVRQTLALCLFMIAVECARKKKWIIYFMLVGIAAFIHNSAVLLLPFYFYINIKKNHKRDIRIFTVIPAVLIVSTTLLGNLVDQVLSYINNLNYSYYYSQNVSSSLRSTLITLTLYIVVLVSLKHLDGVDYQYAMLFLFGLLCGLISYRINMIGRIQMYFDVFGIIALPTICRAIRKVYVSKRIHTQANGERCLAIVSMRDCKGISTHHFSYYIVTFVPITIYLLRYVSFFLNKEWSPFFVYRTIFFK